jgi:hypothetical protein
LLAANGDEVRDGVMVMGRETLGGAARWRSRAPCCWTCA